MKNKKTFLKLDEDHTEIEIGLIRLIKPIPEHELLFAINKINTLNFKRISDIKIEGQYFDYFYARYEAFDEFSQNKIQFISNKSSFSEEKRAQNLLFSDESNIKFLLNLHQDVDYILTNTDLFANFSVILLPENLVFQIQEFELSSNEELYQLIQYYE